MRDITDKVDSSAPPDGRLLADEYNDHKNEIQEIVERSGQTLAIGKTPEQAPRALFINGTGAQSMQDSGTANSIIITPVTGVNGMVVPDAYSQFESCILEFTKAAVNSSTAVVVNIGQTTGTLLGAKDLLKWDGSAVEVGEVVGRCRIIWDNGADKWKLLSNQFNVIRPEPIGYKNGCQLKIDGATLKVTPGKMTSHGNR